MANENSETDKLSAQARAYGDRCAKALFAGRKGHGGGPCSYRTFTPADVAALTALAFDAGRTAQVPA